MDDYPSNSREPKPAKKAVPDVPPRRVERPVVTSKVVRRKQPVGTRLKELFIGDSAHNVWNYVALDVMLPAAKDMIADAVSQGVERMIFGEARSTSRRTGQRPGGYVAYNRYSPGNSQPTQNRRDERREVSRRSRASHDFDEIILATRVEAEEVIDALFNLVGKYETATVGDLYELVNVPSNYTDDKWGWTDLRGAGVTRVRNGYLLDLPRPEAID
jgi:hypothetical protein